MKRMILSAAALLASFGMAAAQNQLQKQPPPPNGATTGGGTLSQKLNQSNGVIQPREDVDPGMTKAAPNPNPDSTPVIPPPGSPGGSNNVQPK